MKFFSSLSFPGVMFYVLIFFDSAVRSLYLIHRLEPPSGFEFFVTLGLLWLVIWWLKEDSTKHEVKLVYCLGLLVYVAWIIILPYYLLKTRGAKALLVLLYYGGAVLAGYITGATYYALSGD
jgi:hypothetical protein